MEQQKHNPKVEWGFYATTPRIVRTQYKNITLVEKWLYVCLKDLCGDTGTCYRTLRVLASETDLALGTLSTGIRHLHDAGLIHAEKKRRSNNPTAKEVWHITIVDIWQENAKVHPTAQRSSDEQKRSGDEHYTQNVQEMNNNVHVANNDASERSGDEQQCSNFDDRSNNIEVRTITEERTMEEESTGEQTDTTTSAPSLSLDAAISSSPHSEIDEAMIREVIAQSSLSSEGEITEEFIQSTIDAFKHRVLVGLRARPLEHPEQEVARTCDTCGRPQTQADCPWCMTTRLPAIPKTPSLPPAVEPGRSGGPTPGAPAPLPGGASHEQNRDATPPRSVAVGQDLGAVASVPIPPVPPEVSLPKTIRATVVSPPPQVLVVSQQFTSVEDWKQAQEAFVEQLRGIWKTAAPDFKRQSGNWNAYRKQYLDRWLKANPMPSEVQFTPDGKTLFDEWCSLFKVKVEAGKANIEAANWLAEPCATWATLLSMSRVEVLRNEKDWCYANDKKGYFNRGVKLFDLKREFEGWQSYQQSLLDKAKLASKTVTRTPTREELRRMPV